MKAMTNPMKGAAMINNGDGGPILQLTLAERDLLAMAVAKADDAMAKSSLSGNARDTNILVDQWAVLYDILEYFSEHGKIVPQPKAKEQ